jgi:hypothetical protein
VSQLAEAFVVGNAAILTNLSMSIATFAGSEICADAKP